MAYEDYARPEDLQLFAGRSPSEVADIKERLARIRKNIADRKK